VARALTGTAHSSRRIRSMPIRRGRASTSRAAAGRTQSKSFGRAVWLPRSKRARKTVR